MKRIDKKLSELPDVKLNQVKPIVECLMEVLKRKDKGEDITELLSPYEGRLDLLFAKIVKCCGTSIIVHHERSDQYYMINQNKRCVNLTFLCRRFMRIPLSEWLTNNSVFYFNTVLPDLPFSTAIPLFEGEAHRLVCEISIEGKEIAEFNGFEGDDLKEFFEIMSKNGEFESIDKFKLGNTELNEMHFIAISIHYFLMNNPLDIEVEWKQKGGFELYLILELVEFVPIIEMYKDYINHFDLHPLALIEDQLKAYNESIVSRLEEQGTF